MNLTVTIIGLVIIGSFVLFAVSLSMIRDRNKKKFLSLITEFAESQSCKISDYDQWKDSCIGIDGNQHKIFYISKRSGNLVKTEINLKDVAKCKLEGVNMTGNTISNSHLSIDEIVLSFSYSTADKDDTKVEFFRRSTDFTIVNEDIKRAEKWFKISQTGIAGLLNNK
jgi:hypothetical protein